MQRLTHFTSKSLTLCEILKHDYHPFLVSHKYIIKLCCISKKQHAFSLFAPLERKNKQPNTQVNVDQSHKSERLVEPSQPHTNKSYMLTEGWKLAASLHQHIKAARVISNTSWTKLCAGLPWSQRARCISYCGLSLHLKIMHKVH